MIRVAVVFLALTIGVSSFAQNTTMRSFKPKKGSVCYMKKEDVFTNVPAPTSYLKKRASNARTATANIEVTYVDFTPEAQAAFQGAVDIWESILVSDVKIKVIAQWAPLADGVLGSAGPGTYISSFEGAPKIDVWYPVAMAEKIAGKDLNPTEDPDIVATFNSDNPDWHYDINSQPPAGDYDLMSIVLHELGHGLGITHSYQVIGNNGLLADFFANQPVAFETNLESFAGENLLSSFTQPSLPLKAQLTGNLLLFNSPLVLAANANQRARVYAPIEYAQGSSIAHMDEGAYPPGSVNSLMTPFINSAERILNPGPIVSAILEEIGWKNTFIEHKGLKNVEIPVAPFEVKAKIRSDNGYNNNSVKLNYSIDGANLVTVSMTATGVPNEFSAAIPIGGAVYHYYISVTDNDQREFTRPGIAVAQGSAPQQTAFEFEVGPDTKAPFINHTPKEFITNNESLLIEAIISDKIGIDEAKIEWKLNDVDQPSADMTLVADTDSTYLKEFVFAADFLHVGDIIKYRIKATDSSVAGNTTTTAFFEVKVTGLLATRDFYENDFDALSDDDFFGNGFSMSTPEGFNDGAIHSIHPYLAGAGGTNDERTFIYTLKVPIKVKTQEATIKFDEVVLVEPGEQGAAFGTADFYDYVVVEGSIDGGTTWAPVADGYDARANGAWLTRYNSATDNDGNSTAQGDATLFKTRTLDLLTKFSAGDEVAIRFKLFSDPHAVGWGWAIDNLRIQIDETPPTILHQHIDYVLKGTQNIQLDFKITDFGGVDKVFVDYKVNAEEVSVAELIVDPTVDLYSFVITVTDANLVAGDVFSYRIRSLDKAGNEGSFPTSTDFINAIVVDFSSPVSRLETDFTPADVGLSGNFFSNKLETLFQDKAMHSVHPYQVGFGIDGTSSISFMMKKALKVDDANPMIVFDEIVVTEYSSSELKDYVVVEGSSDGITWKELIEPYSADANPTWKLSFDNEGTPNFGLYQNRRFDLTANGNFKGDDVILVRFRLFSNSTKAGWGWVVDNLSIQGSITGLEDEREDLVSIYPNPATDGVVRVRTALSDPGNVGVQLLSAQGQVLRNEQYSSPAGTFDQELTVNDWAEGIYLMKVTTAQGSVVRKIVIAK